MIFFIDIILNHTSFDSEWVKDSPNAVFTVKNTPMLHTAFIVDQVIYEWGEEVKEMMSFDVELTEEILSQIEQNLLNRLVHLKLHEYFQLSKDT
jgi:glycogen debranching enzyme